MRTLASSFEAFTPHCSVYFIDSIITVVVEDMMPRPTCEFALVLPMPTMHIFQSKWWRSKMLSMGSRDLWRSRKSTKNELTISHLNFDLLFVSNHEAVLLMIKWRDNPACTPSNASLFHTFCGVECSEMAANDLVGLHHNYSRQAEPSSLPSMAAETRTGPCTGPSASVKAMSWSTSVYLLVTYVTSEMRATKVLPLHKAAWGKVAKPLVRVYGHAVEQKGRVYAIFWKEEGRKRL